MRIHRLALIVLILALSIITVVFTAPLAYHWQFKSRWESLQASGSIKDKSKFINDLLYMKVFGKRPAWVNELYEPAANHVYAQLRQDLVRLRTELTEKPTEASHRSNVSPDNPLHDPQTLPARDARSEIWKLKSVNDRTYFLRVHSAWPKGSTEQVSEPIRKQFAEFGFREVTTPAEARLHIEARIDEGQIIDTWVREERAGDKVVNRTPLTRKSYVSLVRVLHKGQLAFESRKEVKPPHLGGFQYRDYTPKERQTNPVAMLANPTDLPTECPLKQHLSVAPFWALLVAAGQTDQALIFREGLVAGLLRDYSGCYGEDYFESSCRALPAPGVNICKAALLDACIDNRLNCRDYRLQKLYGAWNKQPNVPEVLQFLTGLNQSSLPAR